jgi:ribonuclease III
MNISKLLKFEKKLKIKFKDKNLFIKALTHKSANHKINNEKLEFLGDRVLALTISKKLFDLYPNENEGILDKRLAKMVNRKTCSTIGWLLGIQNYLILADAKKKIAQEDEKILSDSCEALIGAIYIDSGFDYVKKFILKYWKRKIDESNVTVLDSKTKLQEYSLKKFKKLPIYTLVDFKGPKHKPNFKISVLINGSKKFYGTGKSKQEAEQNCASNLLKSININ